MSALLMLFLTNAMFLFAEDSTNANLFDVSALDMATGALTHIIDESWVTSLIVILGLMSVAAVLIGWLWGYLWNRSWKPWTRNLYTYVIAALMASFTLSLALYWKGNDHTLLESYAQDAGKIQGNPDLQKYKDDVTIDGKTPRDIEAMVKCVKDVSETLKIEQINAQKALNSYRTFMQYSLYGVFLSLIILFLAVAVMSYADIKTLKPAVKMIPLYIEMMPKPAEKNPEKSEEN